MKTETMHGVNVAPTSDSGHYVQKANRVIDLDNVTESFFVEAGSVPIELTTKNHTTLIMREDCLINSQVVYNPFAKMYENSRD